MKSPPVGAQTIFPVEFLHKNCTIDKGHQTLLICEKFKKKTFYRFKMEAMWKFLFRVIGQYHKIWRTTFPKEYFDEIKIKKERNHFDDFSKLKRKTVVIIKTHCRNWHAIEGNTCVILMTGFDNNYTCVRLQND